ncbi:MAG: peptidyl-prolyl cis-trans isomerase, partial [Desulfobulbia bacterium]
MPSLSRIYREPLFHFFIVGLIIFFTYYAIRGNDQPAADIISVTPEKISRLGAGFSAVWKRQPSDKELKRLIEDYVREEVYYRDALALGLDSNDTIVRRRLRQKMEFLANSG